MENNIWAMFDHYIADDTKSLKQQHARCPKNGWCKYWTDQKNYNPRKRLPMVFRGELEPIFKDLSSESLLNRCLLGLTQNQNESINNVLWRFCAKITFIGRGKLEMGVCETIGKFNSGAGFSADLIERLCVEPGSNTIDSLKAQDTARTYFAAVKISNKARITRQKLRGQKKRKSEIGKTTYFPGAFGLSTEPDINLGDKPPPKKKAKIATSERKGKTKKNLKISFQSTTTPSTSTAPQHFDETTLLWIFLLKTVTKIDNS